MKDVGKVVGVNLLILLIYIVATTSSHNIGALLTLLIGHVFVNILLGIIFILSDSTKKYGYGSFLSSLLILLIGFSACVSMFK